MRRVMFVDWGRGPIGFAFIRDVVGFDQMTFMVLRFHNGLRRLCRSGQHGKCREREDGSAGKRDPAGRVHRNSPPLRGSDPMGECRPHPVPRQPENVAGAYSATPKSTFSHISISS